MSRHQPEKEQPSSSSHEEDQDSRETLTIGFLASPGFCERIISDLSPDLPDALAEHIDDRIAWEVVIQPDPLTGSRLAAPDLLNEVDARSKANDWDYTISLTDLPVRRNEQFIIADVSIGRGIAWISLPSLGAVRIRSKIKAAVLQVASEMRWGTPMKLDEDQDTPLSNESPQRDTSPSQLIGNGVAHQVTPSREDMDIDVRYIAPRVIGHARVLAGMVYANRPWRLFPVFKTAVAAAIATGAYMNIFSTLWELANAYGIPRRSALMLLAMFVLITWVTVSHNLWVVKKEQDPPYLTTLYNVATVLTITVAVIFAYVTIFLLLLIMGSFFIPSSLLEATLQHPITTINYVNIAWVTASAAMIAGAVGASLDDTEAVRDATFGWRQQRRYEEYEQDKKEEDESA